MDKYFPRSHLSPVFTFDSITTLRSLDSGLIILLPIHCVFITELQGCYEGLWDESFSPLPCVLLRNTIVVGLCCLPYQRHSLSMDRPIYPGLLVSFRYFLLEQQDKILYKKYAFSDMIGTNRLERTYFLLEAQPLIISPLCCSKWIETEN